jgi:hypothetical protein
VGEQLARVNALAAMPNIRVRKKKGRFIGKIIRPQSYESIMSLP